MNIWIINNYATPPSLGSLTRHYYFSKYLTEKGHFVKIITASTIHNSSINMIPGKELYMEKEIDGVSYTFVKTKDYHGNGLDRIYNLIEFCLKIWPVCRQFKKPDVIYASSPDIFAAFSALLWAKSKHIKCIVEIRDLWPESIVVYMKWSARNPMIKILYYMEKWIYQHADQLIFTMEGGCQYILDKKWESKIPLNKVHHLNNGIDIDECVSNCKEYSFHDLDLDNENTFKIIYAGSIRKVNNVRQIIDCAKILKHKSDIVFLIYGTGTEAKDLTQYCKEQNISNVHFKGRVEKKYIPYILSKGDLNLVNNMQTNMFRYGSSLNKLFEYLASGRPVISNVEQHYCLINRYGCGISRRLSTPEEYAAAIMEIYDMPLEQYEKLCTNARNTALLYDYRKLTDSLETILLMTRRLEK